MLNKLRKQLSKMGINKAQADAGTSEGYPVIFLRWNGREDIYAGYSEDDPMDEFVTEERYSNWKDENLS